jgi:hypothetical protein
MPSKYAPDNDADLLEMDRHLKNFVYRFLPALFSDIGENVSAGFSEGQAKQINSYFNHAVTLCALAYPYRSFLIFGVYTHVKIRKLHKLFRTWCEACSTEGTPLETKIKLHHKMQDALGQVSKNYQVVSKISLTDEQRRLVLTVTSSINETVKELPKLGLASLDHFIQWSTDIPGSISGFRHGHTTPSGPRNKPAGTRKKQPPRLRQDSVPMLTAEEPASEE